ncbi:hypothetical protein V8E55_007310, partial [Tylopilus felleus]
QDLECSIRHFGHALDICPLDHPCRAAAQSNLAMAKLIFCQVRDMDSSLGIPLRLYRNALDVRPTGHPDRPSTLIQLAAVHFVKFQKQTDHVDKAQAEALLHEAMELGSTGSHEKQASAFLLQ